MLTIIPVEVAVVVSEVGPFEFTHRKLRSELEGALAGVRFGNKALERIAGDDEADLVRRCDPSRVAALSKPVGNGCGDDRVNQHEVARPIEPSGTQGLLVDPKREPTVALELVARDGLFTQLERTSGEVEQVFLYIGVVAEVFNRIRAQHDLEELAFLSGKRLGEHFFAKERAQLVEGLEVQRTIRQRLSKLRVDVLHVTRKVRAKRSAGVHDVLHTGLDQVLIPDVRVDDLQDALFKRDLRLKVASLESRPGLLDANTRTGPAQRLQLELVFSGPNNVRSGAYAAKRGVVDESWRGQRSSRNGHFFNHRANHIRHVRQSAAVDGVDVGGLASENASDLPNDTIYVFAGEILNSRQRNAVVSHNELLVVLNSLPTHSGKQQVQGRAANSIGDSRFGDLLLTSAERFCDLFRFTSRNVLHTEQQHRVAIAFSLSAKQCNYFFIQLTT